MSQEFNELLDAIEPEMMAILAKIQSELKLRLDAGATGTEIFLLKTKIFNTLSLSFSATLLLNANDLGNKDAQDARLIAIKSLNLIPEDNLNNVSLNPAFH